MTKSKPAKMHRQGFSRFRLACAFTFYCRLRIGDVAALTREHYNEAVEFKPFAIVEAKQKQPDLVVLSTEERSILDMLKRNANKIFDENLQIIGLLVFSEGKTRVSL